MLFHLLFRTSAVLVYLFCTWFSDGFVTSFVLTVILLALDFWTVKNITGKNSSFQFEYFMNNFVINKKNTLGRILVGLRWWSYVDAEGKTHWVYEARKVIFLSFKGTW